MCSAFPAAEAGLRSSPNTVTGLELPQVLSTRTEGVAESVDSVLAALELTGQRVLELACPPTTYAT
jgi:hypothetical protein